MPAALLPREPSDVEAPEPVKPTTGLSPYAEAALDSACRRIIVGAGRRAGSDASTAECFAIGTLAGAGAMPADFARRALAWAARQIREYDPRRPWSAREIETKVARALRRRSCGSHGRCAMPEAPIWETDPDLQRRGRSRAAALSQRKTERLSRAATPHVVHLTSAADLVARQFKEPKWAVPQIIAEGLTILAGKPKTGKSWAGLDFAVAVAGGYSALGNIDCQQGDVLLLALEDNDRRLHQRLKAVLQGQAAPAALQIATQWRRADAGGLDDLQGWLDAHPHARLVLIDTLANDPRRAEEKRRRLC